MERFMCYVKVVESFLGQLVPNKIEASNNNISDESKRNKLLASMFMGGADQLRYKNLKTNLHNGFIEGKDNYPTTDYNCGPSSANDEGHSANSFAQMPKNPCPKCRKRHPYGPCSSDDASRSSQNSRSTGSLLTQPFGQSHVQVEQEEDDDDDNSYGNSYS
jgi:hypothetical protein